MSSNKKLGKTGEDIATRFIKGRNYLIIERNYRCKIGEIDLIAKKDNTICFIEVKTRKSESYGRPEESINQAKIKKIKTIASYYLTSREIGDLEVSFDAILIRFKSGEYHLKHIKNAF